MMALAALFNRRLYATPEQVPITFKHLDSPIQRTWSKFWFSGVRRERLYSRLAGPISSGLSHREALFKLYQRVAFRRPKSVEAVVMRSMIYQLERGRLMSDGLSYFVPLNELMLVRVGESHSNMAAALNGAARAIDERSEMKDAIIRAVAVPSFVLIIVFFMLYGIGAYGVPIFEEMMPPGRWQGSAAFLQLLGGFASNGGFLMIAAVAVSLTVVVILSLKRWYGPGRVALDRFPPYSLYRASTGSAWLTMLSAMLSTGQSVWEALETLRSSARAQSNLYVEHRTQKIIEANNSGKLNVALAMENAGLEFPDSELVQDLVMLANKGDFEKIMGDKSSQWISRKTRNVKRLCFWIEIGGYLVVALILLVVGLAYMDVSNQATQYAKGM